LGTSGKRGYNFSLCLLSHSNALLGMGVSIFQPSSILCFPPKFLLYLGEILFVLYICYQSIFSAWITMMFFTILFPGTCVCVCVCVCVSLCLCACVCNSSHATMFPRISSLGLYHQISIEGFAFLYILCKYFAAAWSCSLSFSF